ncbi:MAG: sigma-70 family RNA polymerase sigma factor [Prevotella sp.]|nr:sigma-70 family RNA polymerase sigma factor [Prevotella sp.]
MKTSERDALITGNMGYVVTLARQYKSELLSTDDLVSEGCIGLMKAADKFDPNRGKPFVTFAAPYIRQSIEEAISRITGEVPVMSTDESLPVGSNNNFTLLNVLEAPDAPRADHALEQHTLSDELAEAISTLNEREQAVVRRFFGIDYQRMTMAEIGEELGLKRERVRQIRDKAMRKLKKQGPSA